MISLVGQSPLRISVGKSTAGHLGVDVSELGVPVRFGPPFPDLAVPLQAIVQFVEQFRDHRVADAVALLAQGRRQLAGALAGPAQR